MKFLALLLLFPSLAQAAPLEAVFSAYVKVRQAEESLSLETSEEGRQAVAAKLTEARIEFQDSLANQEKLEAWERSLLSRVEKRARAQNESQAIPFLQKAFPNPKELSPLEWQAVAEWFGKSTQEKFLYEAFSITELPASTGEAPQIVWVKDPFRNLLASPDAIDPKELEKLNPGLITLEISAFPRLDDQAEELRHAVLSLGDKPFVIVSDGEASALVLKMLDLYPGLRDRENIKGWVNVSGRLFGRTEEKKSKRALASLADQFSDAALQDLKRLRQDALVRSAPLGDGFPIVNLFSLDKSRRPVENLREAIVAEGSSWFVKGSAAKRVQQAFPLLTGR